MIREERIAVHVVELALGRVGAAAHGRQGGGRVEAEQSVEPRLHRVARSVTDRLLERRLPQRTTLGHAARAAADGNATTGGGGGGSGGA